MTVFQRIVSLGPACRTRFHIARVLRAGRYTNWRNAPPNFPSSIFNSQFTPAAALIEYLQHDFVGMFKFEDLGFDADGFVKNRRFGTVHPHEFPRPPTRQDLADHFENARARHDYLCGRTREALASPRRSLFVFGGPIDQNDLDIVRSLIAARRKGGFELIVVDDTNSPSTYGPDDDARSWHGNYEVWTKALSRISVDHDLGWANRLKQIGVEQIRRLHRLIPKSVIALPSVRRDHDF